MTSRSNFLLGIGVVYTLLIGRILDKAYWLVPKHMTEKELYDIATSKGINADAVVRGICHLAMKDGVTLNKAHVLAQLGKILTEAKDDAFVLTGDREMVDFMSLDEQQFALLEAMEEGHYPLTNGVWGEKQNALAEQMSPQQLHNLWQLLYHQTLKLKNMGLLDPFQELKEPGTWMDVTNDPPIKAIEGPKEIPSVLEENFWNGTTDLNLLDIELILSIWF